MIVCVIENGIEARNGMTGIAGCGMRDKDQLERKGRVLQRNCEKPKAAGKCEHLWQKKKMRKFLTMER